MPNREEEQVSKLLINADQALNFLRETLDELLLKREAYNVEVQQKIFITQKNFKKHKAVLTNMKSLVGNQEFHLPKELAVYLAIKLKKKISIILEEIVEMGRIR